MFCVGVSFCGVWFGFVCFVLACDVLCVCVVVCCGICWVCVGTLWCCGLCWRVSLGVVVVLVVGVVVWCGVMRCVVL